MVIERLSLSNFRCYESAALDPDPRFNVIYGANGQGKTSILEALGLITFLKSFRQAKNSDMLRHGETLSTIQCVLRNHDLSVNLDVILHPHRKQARYNGKACKFISEYIGKISGVSFSPADLEIIRGSPENRRTWVDKASQILDNRHSDTLARYSKVLEHRNRLLKSVADGRSMRLPEDFSVWTDELAHLGAQVIHNRINTVDKLVEKIARYYSKIAGEKTDITIEYLGQDPASSLELINRTLKDSYEQMLPREKILGSTLVGPHRDDLEIKLSQYLARSNASQGEMRSLILAMRLAEVEAYQEIQGLNPILLIDDFSSELDAERRSFLLDYLVESQSQVFLTTTEKLSIGTEFLVNDGRITPHGSQYLSTGRQQLQRGQDQSP